MCGIAGIIRFDGAPVQADLLRRMTDTLAHRGPDGEGIYACAPVGLGHRRLAIIDLSPAGRQPMPNEDETVWVTFNGEIYNFAEVRAELQQRGHHFRSGTDTEMIVHAYEEWGTDCLKRFNGMFAFGLWDARQRCLWLVRDRLGVKPLFYAHLPGCLLFGSEIKALLCCPEISRELDYEALAYFLALNYTPAPHTLFAQVRQLLPGHYLMIDASGQTQDVAYWDLVYTEDEKVRPERDWLGEFDALLEDAVRLRLVSDVPFGTFLSGGVDSSSVAYWMSRHLDEPVKTFTIGFGEPSFDELEYARLVAQTVNADHHERIVTADAAAVLPKLVWHAEEPTADSSMVAVYYLAQMTREYVTMALSGDGADETIAGYETHQAYYLHRLYRLLPGWLRRGVIAPLIAALPVSDSKVSWDLKLRRFAGAGDFSAEDAHATRRMIFDATARRELLAPVWNYPGIQTDVIDLYRAYFAQTNARRPLNRMLYVDTRLYLPNDMLVKVDRMTMAHGLEAREPMLDYRLVEFLAAAPPNLKLKHLWHKKFLLKAAMRGKLPDRVLWRKKQGFNVPNARWIKGGLRPFVLDHLSPPRVRDIGLLDERAVAAVLHDHFDGRADNSHQIWGLLTLALWWETFIQGDSIHA
jgi:asparagine synthase (glutamine-hydrolysing)